MKQSKGRKVTILNAIGSLGYVACFLQWTWTVLILLPAIIQSPFFRFVTSSSPAAPQPSIVASGSIGSVPLVATVIAFILAGVIIIGSIYIILVKFPRSVVRTGEKVTHTVATVISPVITQHIHLPPKRQRELSMVLIVIMKFLLVFVPQCLLLFAEGQKLSMSFEVIMIIGFTLFSWSFLLFAVQFGLSRLLYVDYKTIR